MVVTFKRSTRISWPPNWAQHAHSTRSRPNYVILVQQMSLKNCEAENIRCLYVHTMILIERSSGSYVSDHYVRHMNEVVALWWINLSRSLRHVFSLTFYTESSSAQSLQKLSLIIGAWTFNMLFYTHLPASVSALLFLYVSSSTGKSLLKQLSRTRLLNTEHSYQSKHNMPT